MTREPRWQDAAACFGFDPDLWFAERRGEEPIAAVAISVCQSCPVQQDCLDEALRTGDQGILGGATTKQRAGMDRTRRAAA